jgi:hypothetical protein
MRAAAAKEQAPPWGVLPVFQARQLFDDIFGKVHRDERDETETLGHRASDRFGITRRRHRTALDAGMKLIINLCRVCDVRGNGTDRRHKVIDTEGLAPALWKR